MIGYLRGLLLKTAPDLVLLDVQGVGYEVRIPLSTYYEVQKTEGGASVAFYVHTHVRDDALMLFGFWTERERQLFERLIAVSGIGPKLAQTILSGMMPDDLIAALSAARALAAHTDLEAPAIAVEALRIAASVDLYTNDQIVVEELE